MFKYFKNRKIKKEAEIEQYRWEQEEKVREATVKMLFSPCAIKNSENCDQSCVHFKPGGVEYLSWPLDDEEPRFWVEMPKCKLWR